MDNKPKFGLGAQPGQKPKLAESAASKDQPKQACGINAKPNTATPQGPKFGTEAAPKNTLSKGDQFKRIFTMQPIKFWIIQYAFGVAGLLLGMAMGLPLMLSVINLILYPFTVTILQSIGQRRDKRSTLGDFFFGFSVAMIGESLWWILIYGAFRFIIFMLKFTFSFLLGTIGLVYIWAQAKKING